jgi:sec-independent protein translocase protein TatB
MFGIGLTELLIIGVIALLVVGPDKLPEMAQKLGRFVWDIRRAWDDVRDTVRTEMMSVQQPFDDLRNAGKNAREAFKNEFNAVKADTAGSLQQAVDEAKAAAAAKSDGGRQTSDAGQTRSDVRSQTSDAGEIPAPAAGDPQPVTAAPEPTETTVTPQAYQPRPVSGPAITYFDLDGNPVAAPEKG